jgi:hypothetical protein
MLLHRRNHCHRVLCLAKLYRKRIASYSSIIHAKTNAQRRLPRAAALCWNILCKNRLRHLLPTAYAANEAIANLTHHVSFRAKRSAVEEPPHFVRIAAALHVAQESSKKQSI